MSRFALPTLRGLMRGLLAYLPEPLSAGKLDWVPNDVHPLPEDPTFDPNVPSPQPRTLAEHPGAALFAQWRMPWLYSTQELILINEYLSLQLHKSAADMLQRNKP